MRGDDGKMPVSVDYTTTDGTALDGVDYQRSSGTLTFAVGELKKIITIPIFNDGVLNGSRSFNISLSNAVSSIGLGPIQNAQISIVDNDMGISFSQSSYVVSETNKAVEITVIRGDDGNVPVSVDYATGIESGQPPSYVPQSGTLIFGAGEMRKSFTVPILNNNVAAGDFVVQLTLSKPGTGNLVTLARARLTILDDERPLVLDASFDVGNGADERVSCMAVLPDGKLLVAGEFLSVNGVGRTRIARLFPDGSVDLAFNTDNGRGGIDALVTCLFVQQDGLIFIGGHFNAINGISRNRVAKLKPDGALEDSFTPGAIEGGVESLALQQDGKVIIGGWFNRVAGVNRQRLVRLETDGRLDAGFLPPSINDSVVRIALQADGKILVAGYFQRVQGTTRKALFRLNSNGSLDVSYNPIIEGPASTPVPVLGLHLIRTAKLLLPEASPL